MDHSLHTYMYGYMCIRTYHKKKTVQFDQAKCVGFSMQRCTIYRNRTSNKEVIEKKTDLAVLQGDEIFFFLLFRNTVPSECSKPLRENWTFFRHIHRDTA